MAGFTYAAILRVETLTFWLNCFHEQWFELILGWLVVAAGIILLIRIIREN